MNHPAAPAREGERTGYAPLTNMRLALSALTQAADARGSTTRFCMLYGFSGYGKSVAGAYVASKFDAAYVECRSTERELSFLRRLADEFGITKPKRFVNDLLDQVIEQIRIEPRPIVVDEMDHLVKNDLVDIIRDIHDNAYDVPILMIGEETLPTKLKAWERFDNRILVASAAQPASGEDARLLRDHYCNRVEIADDLVEAIADRCKGVTRRIVVNLRAAQVAALDDGVTAIDRAWWGDRPMLTGDVQTRRRAA